MSKNKSIQEKLASRIPATMRQVITPIDMLEQKQQQNTPSEGTKERMNERSKERTEQRTDGQPNDRTSVRANERTDKQASESMEMSTEGRLNERTKVRHSFDVFLDQLDDLREIALARQKATRRRVLLGDLVQEALDAFIKSERSNG